MASRQDIANGVSQGAAIGGAVGSVVPVLGSTAGTIVGGVLGGAKGALLGHETPGAYEMITTFLPGLFGGKKEAVQAHNVEYYANNPTMLERLGTSKTAQDMRDSVTRLQTTQREQQAQAVQEVQKTNYLIIGAVVSVFVTICYAIITLTSSRK
jgi:hypothetical protein